MAEFIPVSLIKNNLTECPICTEQFEEEVRIPRRMPCCVQSICQPCLETYSRGQKKVPCPMCRCEHLLPGGVTSLAKEPLILRILEQLKIQKGVKIPCTDCPDKNNAVARCEDCCISLCEECLRAHRRVPTLKNHNLKTFEELKDLPIESVKRVHQCEEHRHPLEFFCTTCDKVICVSCTVLEHEKGDNHSVISISKAHKERSEEMNAFLTKLEEKAGDLTEAVRKLEVQRDAFKDSSVKARENVTSTFNSLIEVLELKKATLLSQLDNRIEVYLNQLQVSTEEAKKVLTQVRSSTEYTRNMRRKADQIEDIQLISSSMPTLESVHEKKIEDLKLIDIEKEVDALKELNDVIHTYLQEHPAVGPIFQAPAVVPSVEQQMSEIQKLLDTPLKKGDSWYLVDIKWSNHLRSFLGLDTHGNDASEKTPGPIDNTPLLKENGELKLHLIDDIDYHFYSEEAWSKLVSWYGIMDSQIPLRRQVIMLGMYGKQCRIEVYRMPLRIQYGTMLNNIRIQFFSRAVTIGHLETVIRREFDITEEKPVRMLKRFRGLSYRILDNSLLTLHDCGLHDNEKIIIDEMNEDGSWTIHPEMGKTKKSKRLKAKGWTK